MQFNCKYDKKQFKVTDSTITKVANDSDFNNSVLLGGWINGGRATLKIKVNKLKSSYGGICLAILPKEVDVKHDYYKTCPGNCQWQSDGDVYFSGINKGKKANSRFVEGDTVSFTVDFPSCKLLYAVQSKYKNKNGVLMENVDITNKRFKFAMKFYNIKDSASILSIDVHNEEQKHNETEIETDMLRKQINELKIMNEKLQNDVIKAVEKSSKMQNENVPINNKVTEYVQQNSLLQSEICKLKKVVEELQNEKKDMEMEIIELKKENSRLKLKNLDPNEYQNWSTEQVVYWIISLDNGSYKQYGNILTKSLSEENIDGECLSEIDSVDIKIWGIKDYRHRKAIYNHIKLLINNKKNKSNYNEGTNTPTAYI
eukprot:456597_1